MRADLASPILFPDRGSDEDAWMREVNNAWHSDGMADIGLLPSAEAATPFDRLTVPDAPRVTEGPLVTVLMSAHQPGPSLLTAVRSLLEQSWSNFELLIVDDASDIESQRWLEQVEAWDRRITVIRKAVNGGTYRARNTALLRARGEFVTVLDSDDWMHAQGLETLVVPLLQQPGLVATRAEGVRVTEDLQLTRIGYRTRLVSAASLTFRRSMVLNRIGFFDPVRKGADSEFALRIQAAFVGRLRDIPEVVIVLRAGETLSSSEFGWRWRHPTRYEYKSGYFGWHQRISEGQASPIVGTIDHRSALEPLRWERPLHPLLASCRHVDLCLLADLREPSDDWSAMIDSALDGGLSVGISHLESLRRPTTKDEMPGVGIRQMVERGLVRWVHHDDDVSVQTMVAMNPGLFEFPPMSDRRATVGQLVLHALADETKAERPERASHGSAHHSARRGLLSARAEEMWGVRPEWADGRQVWSSVIDQHVERSEEPTQPRSAPPTWRINVGVSLDIRVEASADWHAIVIPVRSLADGEHPNYVALVVEGSPAEPVSETFRAWLRTFIPRSGTSEVDFAALAAAPGSLGAVVRASWRHVDVVTWGPHVATPAAEASTSSASTVPAPGWEATSLVLGPNTDVRIEPAEEASGDFNESADSDAEGWR